MVVLGLGDVVNDNLPFKVLRVMRMRMAIVILLWGKDRERQAAQTSTRSAAAAAAAVRDGCSCQSQVENEYPACKHSHLAFPLMKGGNVGQIHRM